MTAKPSQPISWLGVDLRAPGDRLVAGYTGRGGGISAPPYDSLNLSFRVGDSFDDVHENRRRLATAIGIPLDCFVFSQLEHGANVAVVRSADGGRGAYDYASAVPATDAMITRETGIALAVNVADCAAVLLHDPVAPAVAVIHAGWRGAFRHVASAAVAAMRMEFGTDARDAVAVVGPSLGPASYVVSGAVAAQVRDAYSDVDVVRTDDGVARFDLWNAVRADLLQAGLRPENVDVLGVDTFLAGRAFFSARACGTTGRFAAVIALRQ